MQLKYFIKINIKKYNKNNILKNKKYNLNFVINKVI